MLVDRRTFIVKKGHWDEAIGLLLEMKRKFNETGGVGTVRVYSSMIGPFDTIAYELEIESLTAWERGETAWMAAHHEWAEAWYARWTAATEPGGELQVWRIEE